MVRIYKGQAKLLLALLVAIRHYRAEDPQAYDGLVEAAASAFALTDNGHHPTAQVLLTTRLSSITSDLELDQFIEELTEQVASTDSSGGDRPILNAIVEFLGLPWTGNRVGSDTLDALRKAVLRPSEIANFSKVSKEAFVCTGCSHKFNNRELGVFERGPNNNIVVRCINCASPQVASCSHCRESATLNVPALQILRSGRITSCSCLEKPAKSKKEAFISAQPPVRQVIWDAVGEVDADRLDILRQAGLMRGATGPRNESDEGPRPTRGRLTDNPPEGLV